MRFGPGGAGPGRETKKHTGGGGVFPEAFFGDWFWGTRGPKGFLAKKGPQFWAFGGGTGGEKKGTPVPKGGARGDGGGFDWGQKGR